MPTAIHRKVKLAQEGNNPYAIIQLKSGWVMAAEKPVVPGYCLLMSDPVATSLNALTEAQRVQYCLDMIRIGDALLDVTNAVRINYETWCNLDPALHTHIVPRFAWEAEQRRILPVVKGYDAVLAPAFDPVRENHFMIEMKRRLEPFAR